jgi:hypothetical protein
VRIHGAGLTVNEAPSHHARQIIPTCVRPFDFAGDANAI